MTTVKKLQQEFYKLNDIDQQAFLSGIVAQSTGQTEVSGLKAEINQVKKKHCPHCMSYSIVANGKNHGCKDSAAKHVGKTIVRTRGHRWHT